MCHTLVLIVIHRIPSQRDKMNFDIKSSQKIFKKYTVGVLDELYVRPAVLENILSLYHIVIYTIFCTLVTANVAKNYLKTCCSGSTGTFPPPPHTVVQTGQKRKRWPPRCVISFASHWALLGQISGSATDL